MTEPEESEESDERSEPIVAPPTANPARVRVPPKGSGQQKDDEQDPAPSGPRPGEEA